jgi:hypothetical protein
MGINMKYISIAFICISFYPILASANWGIKNDGRPQPIDTDHFTSSWVPGIAGEDIHLSDFFSKPISKKTTVAIIDTGIDLNHPKLINSISSASATILEKDTSVQDQSGHGTHVAGIIQQVSGSLSLLAIKAIRSNPNAPIRPQSTSETGTALTEDVARAIHYAIDHKASVINLSLSWPKSIRSTAMDQAILRAEESNVLLVASVGNDSTDADVYPCAYPSVICVGSHGPDGAFSHFSNHGPSVDVLAPGLAIFSTWPMDKKPKTYAGGVGSELRNGTSMSAPFVSGVLGAMIEQGIPALDARAKILVGSRPVRNPSPLQPQYLVQAPSDLNESQNQKLSQASKSLRFGNLDADNAINQNKIPLVLPWYKGSLSIPLGSKSVLIPFKNIWANSTNTTIRIKNHQNTISEHKIGNIASGQIVSLRVDISFLSAVQNQSDPVKKELIFEIESDPEQKQMHSIRSCSVPVNFYQPIAADLLPANAIVDLIDETEDLSSYSVRSLITTQKNTLAADYVFLKNKTITDTTPPAKPNDPEIQNKNSLQVLMVRGNKTIASTVILGRSEDELLGAYLTANQNYAFVFSDHGTTTAKSKFYLKYFDFDLKPLFEFNLSTSVTVFSESFLWDGDMPVWVSIGSTPKLDQPTYDPWKPNHKDTKFQRLYTVMPSVDPKTGLTSYDLRLVQMPTIDWVPVVIIPGHPVLALLATGNGHQMKYDLHEVNQGKMKWLRSLTPDTDPNKQFPMLFGANSSSVYSITSLQQLFFSTPSTPGNLFLSVLDRNHAGAIFQSELVRSSQLEAIIQSTAVYNLGNKWYAFGQTHYDLKFFDLSTSQLQVSSTSLNRYSYIPSMIASRNFFPTSIRAKNDQSFPALYIPASQANGFRSEIIVADLQNQNQLKRLAHLRFQIQDERCQGLGNLTAATQEMPAEQIFFCGNQRIRIPLEL